MPVYWSADVGYTSFYPYQYSSGKRPLRFYGQSFSYGGGNSAGTLEARWLNANGETIRNWTTVSGFNTRWQNDGGSGMGSTSSITIPVFESTYEIDFRGGGRWGASIEIWAVALQ